MSGVLHARFGNLQRSRASSCEGRARNRRSHSLRRAFASACDGNLRRSVSPSGVSGQGDNASAAHADSGADSDTNLDAAAENATVRVYDAEDQLTQVHLPWNSGDTRKFVQQFIRDGDPLDRLLSIHEAHQSSDSNIPITNYTYYDNDWIASSTDTRNVNSSGAAAQSLNAQYSYDTRGNQTLWKISGGDSNASREVQRTYWPDGLLQMRKALLTGASDTDAQTKSYQYFYDANRTLSGFRDVKADRLTSVRSDDAERQSGVDETWDAGKDSQFAYDPDGNVKTRSTDGDINASDGFAHGDAKTTSFTYDSQGEEVAMHVAPATGAARDTTTAWYPSGDMQQRVKPDGVTERYFFNTRGDPSAHGRSGGPDPAVAQSYAYDTNGNRSQDEHWSSPALMDTLI